MINESCYKLGAEPSVIRSLFALSLIHIFLLSRVDIDIKQL